MGDIGDQHTVFLLRIQFLLRIHLQALAHGLKTLTEFTDLIMSLGINGKIQIAVPDILCRVIELAQTGNDTAVGPDH